MKQIQTAAFSAPEYEVRWEAAYRPRISRERLHRLWLLKQRTRKPITQMIAEALDRYFASEERR